MLIAAMNRVQYIRRRIYSRALRRWGGFKACGDVSFDPGIRIDNPGGMRLEEGVLVLRGSWLYCVPGDDGVNRADLFIGAGTYIGCYSHITCVNKVYFGPRCVLGNYVHVTDHTHGYEDLTLSVLRQPLKFGAVEIKEGAFIGEHCSISGDIKIGRHAVVGANTVLSNCEIPDYCVVVGSPPRIIRRYDSSTDRWPRCDSSVLPLRKI
jgi:acetyltransferase-like isoleucine patch superfamily enzyme